MVFKKEKEKWSVFKGDVTIWQVVSLTLCLCVFRVEQLGHGKVMAIQQSLAS